MMRTELNLNDISYFSPGDLVYVSDRESRIDARVSNRLSLVVSITKTPRDLRVFEVVYMDMSGQPSLHGTLYTVKHGQFGLVESVRS